ncbi:MAG: hypothetical protein GY761_03670 [Hyphomicrobiales bacterium]|nr:hypothetical protein [Hyphomicrobiales bacterium]
MSTDRMDYRNHLAAHQPVSHFALLFILEQTLKLDPAKPVVERGWVFRGPVSLSVVWDV